MPSLMIAVLLKNAEASELSGHFKSAKKLLIGHPL